MTALNRWDFPGGASDHAVLPVSAAYGHFRTDTGYGAWSVAILGNLDTLAPAGRGAWFGVKRTATDAINHSICFEPGSDNLECQYQLAQTFETSASSETAGTWCLYAFSYAGNGGNLTIRRIPLSTAVQSHSATGAPGGSNWDDAQAQTLSLGGIHNGSSVQEPIDAKIAGLLILKGVELSQSGFEDLAADWLNEGDALVDAHGTNCVFYDDTGLDVGGNALGALTLNGSVSYGAGGPTVPDRAAVGSSPSVNAVGNFGIQYYGEQHVVVNGTGFGTVEPIVTVNQDPISSAGTPLHVYSYSATQLIVDMPVSGVTGASQLWVENRTPGVSFGLKDSRAITMNPDPGSNVIALRTGIPSINMQSGVAISFQTRPHFYHRGAQEVSAYSKASGAFPTGLSLGSSTGLITGTIDSGAAAGSPYNSVVRITDMNGDVADQALNWTVTAVAAPTATSGSWGRRQPR